MATLQDLEKELLDDWKLDTKPAERKDFPSPDLLILVVNDHELQAALRFLNLTSRVTLDSLSYHVGWWTCVPDVSVVLVQQPKQGSSGVGKAQSVISRAVMHWQPRLVCGVGVAFGFDKSKHSLMDVLVSELVLPYSWVREDDIATENRNMPLQISSLVLNLFQSSVGSASNWQLAKLQQDTGTTWCKAHQGAIFCGDVLVDSSVFKEKLAKLFALNKNKYQGVEVIGGEMEGVGIFAPCQEQAIPCIVIKGVCDFGEGKAQLHQGIEKASIQRKAAYAAFSLLSHVLESNGRSALPPHYAPVSSATVVLPTTWTTVVPEDESYPACVQVLQQQELYNSERSRQETRIAERKADAAFMKRLEDAQVALQKAQEEFDQLNMEVTLNLDETNLRKAKEELTDAKWEFGSANLKVTEGANLIGTIKRSEKKRSIAWSGKSIKKYVNPTTFDKMTVDLRPPPDVSLDVAVMGKIPVLEKMPKHGDKLKAEKDIGKQKSKRERDTKKKEDSAGDEKKGKTEKKKKK